MALALLPCSAVLHAQPRIINAFYDWQDLVLADLTANATNNSVSSNDTSSAAGKKSDVAKAKAKQKAKLALHKKAAGLAKHFYTAYPTDANAPKARKMEALAVLRGIDDEDATSEAAAYAIADAFRADKNNAANDRFDVAWLEERRKLTKSTKNNPSSAAKSDIEKLADKLRTECDDAAGAYRVYADLLRQSNMDDANKLAIKLLALKATPGYLKAQAEAETARYKLKGNSPALGLTTIDGRKLSLNTGKGNYTILFIGSLDDKLAIYSAAGSKNIQWVQVFADTSGKFDAKSAKALETGVATVYDPKGTAGPICTSLGVTSLPYVVIIDGNQKIYSYGRAQFLTDLVAEVAK